MNEQVIISVANAITANAEVLKALIEALPRETVAKIEKEVGKKGMKVTPAEVVDATPAPAVVVAPILTNVSVPIASAPVAVMPTAPFPTQPVAAPIPTAPVMEPVVTSVATPAAAPVGLPFADHNGMVAWVMKLYQELGNTKGAQIQGVLESVGVKNINDVKPDHWSSIVTGVLALKG